MRFTTLIFFFFLGYNTSNRQWKHFQRQQYNTGLMGFFFFFFVSFLFSFLMDITVSLSKLYITIMQEPFKKKKKSIKFYPIKKTFYMAILTSVLDDR